MLIKHVVETGICPRKNPTDVLFTNLAYILAIIRDPVPWKGEIVISK